MTDGSDPAGDDVFTPRVVSKPWGAEFIWALTDRYCGKVITIETGRRLSLQYHEQKDEAILVTRGLLRLHLEGDDGTMSHFSHGFTRKIRNIGFVCAKKRSPKQV